MKILALFFCSFFLLFFKIRIQVIYKLWRRQACDDSETELLAVHRQHQEGVQNACHLLHESLSYSGLGMP